MIGPKTSADDNKNKWLVFFVVAVTSFVTPFMGSSVNIALPTIGRAFGMDAVLLSWVASSYLLAAAVFLVPFGRLADIYGRKKVYSYGILVFTLGSLFCGIANSALILILARILQGVGSSMIFGTGIAILTSVFDARERGKALGANVAVVYLGLSVGPFLGGILTELLTWRSVFLINVPLGLLALIFVFTKLKQEWAEARGESFDIAGAVAYGFALTAIIYGFSSLPEVAGAVVTAFGIAAMIAFIYWETRVKSPVLNIKLFQGNTAFAFSNLAALINYSATFAVGFLLSLYLQYIKGFDAQQAGLTLVVMPVVQASLSIFAGRLSDRVQPRLIASAGMTITAIGLFVLVFLNETSPLNFIIASLVLFGIGFALFSSPNTNAIMSSVERRFYGVASGTLSTMRLTGQMVSMGIAMLIFAIFIGRVQITAPYYPLFLKSMKTAFIVFTVLCTLGVFASLARGKKKD